MIQAQLPDGRVLEFPDGTDQSVVDRVVRQELGVTAAPNPNPNPILNSPVGGFIRGLRDPIDAGAQMLEKGLQAVGVDTQAINQRLGMPSADEATATAEQDYRANWRGGEVPSIDAGRIAGNIAATVPIGYAMPGAAAATLPARMASGAATGAISGALQPEEAGKEDFWTQKAKQAALGGVVGAAAPAVLTGLSRIVRPNTSPQVRALMQEGVTPTPGQIMGGVANRVEEGAQSLPLVGDAIRAGRTRAAEEFNRAAINRSLTPVGEKLSKGALGREAIEEAANKLSQAYDDLLPKLSVQADQKFASDMAQLQAMAQNLPKERAEQVTRIIKNEVVDRFSQGGGITGESFKKVESTLNRLASQYGKSLNGDERAVGDAVKQALSNLRELLTRSNPQYAKELGAINTGYANLLRVQDAAGRLGANEGVFSPAQLSASVRKLDSSVRKGAFAKGNALMQDLSDAGKAVLGNKVPDSGTPFRLANIGALGMMGGAIPVAPEAAMAAGAGALGASALYSPVGQKTLAAILAQRPAFADPVARGLLELGPAASAGAAGLLAAQ